MIFEDGVIPSSKKKYIQISIECKPLDRRIYIYMVVTFGGIKKQLPQGVEWEKVVFFFSNIN